MGTTAFRIGHNSHPKPSFQFSPLLSRTQPTLDEAELQDMLVSLCGGVLLSHTLPKQSHKSRVEVTQVQRRGGAVQRRHEYSRSQAQEVEELGQYLKPFCSATQS